MKRWLIIVGLSALAILCGAGCIFGVGLETEFWEPLRGLMNRR